MKTHGPIEQKHYETMNELAKGLDQFFNGDVKPQHRKYGFCLLVFPFGHGDDNRINYICNAEREDMITAMKEFIARAEGRHHETESVQ
jgi:hypothetical protein